MNFVQELQVFEPPRCVERPQTIILIMEMIRVIFINFQVRLSAHSESPNVEIHCAICCGAEKRSRYSNV